MAKGTKNYEARLGTIGRNPSDVFIDDLAIDSSIIARRLEDGSVLVAGEAYYPTLPENSVAAQLLKGSAQATVNKFITAGEFDGAVFYRLSELSARQHPELINIVAHHATELMAHPQIQRAILEMQGVQE